MRILKIVQAYFPFQDRGGPVFKVRALARGLAKRGHEVTVLTADLGFGKQNGFNLETEPSRWGWTAKEDGVNTIYLSSAGKYRGLTFNPRVVAFSKSSIQQFDVAHFYGLYDLLGPAVSYFCRRNSVPYVIEPMGMYRPIVRSFRLKRIYHNLLGGRFIGGARCLVATSEPEKQDLLEGGVDAARITIRRNGAEVPSTLPPRGAFRREYGIEADAKLILFLGRLISKKSPDMLLEAFAKWRESLGHDQNAVLVLAGPEEGDGFLPTLKSAADRLKLKGRVLFTGPLYDDAKWSAYQDADVFVLPSQNENFGNTAGEAAACGTAVIVTDRCGIAPFVGAAGAVIPHDVTALEVALRTMLNDPQLRENRREGCREFVARLSWDEPLDQTEEMYRKCVAPAAG